MTQNDTTLAAAVATLAEGRVLHVRADALPGRRKQPRRDAMPGVDLTLGPYHDGGFLLVDYQRVPSGLEERHATAEDAVRAARRLLSWDRMAALRAALAAVHGEPERPAVETVKTRPGLWL